MRVTPKKKTTLDELARMVARGFEQAASKEVLKSLETRVDNEFKLLRAETGTGFQDLKHMLQPLDETVQSHDAELQELRERVDRVEKQLGIGK
jgi:hypothetical protein